MSTMERGTIGRVHQGSLHYHHVVRARVDDTWGSVVETRRFSRFYRVVLVDNRGREHSFTCCGTHPAWIAWDASPRAVATITSIRLAREAREEEADRRAPRIELFPKAKTGDAP